LTLHYPVIIQSWVYRNDMIKITEGWSENRSGHTPNKYHKQWTLLRINSGELMTQSNQRNQSVSVTTVRLVTLHMVAQK